MTNETEPERPDQNRAEEIMRLAAGETVPREDDDQGKRDYVYDDPNDTERGHE